MRTVVTAHDVRAKARARAGYPHFIGGIVFGLGSCSSGLSSVPLCVALQAPSAGVD